MLGLAQTEAADATDEQIADGKIEEAPYDIHVEDDEPFAGW